MKYPLIESVKNLYTVSDIQFLLDKDINTALHRAVEKFT
jgi:hypothetical protein